MFVVWLRGGWSLFVYSPWVKTKHVDLNVVLRCTTLYVVVLELGVDRIDHSALDVVSLERSWLAWAVVLCSGVRLLFVRSPVCFTERPSTFRLLIVHLLVKARAISRTGRWRRREVFNQGIGITYI